MDNSDFKSRLSFTYRPLRPVDTNATKLNDPGRWRGWIAICISVFALVISGANALPGWLNRADKLDGAKERLQALMPFENSRASAVELTDQLGKPFPIHDREFLPGVSETTKPPFQKVGVPELVGRYQIGPIAVTTILSNPTDNPLSVVDIALRQVAIGKKMPNGTMNSREFINRDIQVDPVPPFSIPAHGATRLSIYTNLRLDIERRDFVRCRIYHQIDRLVFCLSGKEDDQPEIALGSRISTIPSELVISTTTGTNYYIGLNGFNIQYEEIVFNSLPR